MTKLTCPCGCNHTFEVTPEMLSNACVFDTKTSDEGTISGTCRCGFTFQNLAASAASVLMMRHSAEH